MKKIKENVMNDKWIKLLVIKSFYRVYLLSSWFCGIYLKNKN